jgi:DNA-binding transcriptional ArsR family regulator
MIVEHDDSKVRYSSYNGEMGTLTSEHAAALLAGADTMHHPEAGEIELVTVLQALSDPIRLRIVAALATGEERTCNSFDLPVGKSTCTHHLRALREAGVIRQRHERTSRLNSLRRDDLEGRFPGLLDAVLRASGA